MIDILRTYCSTHDINFIYGTRAYQNAISGRKKYNAGERILLADFRIRPQFEGYKVSRTQWEGTLALGQVSEETTRANLSEFPIEKYDNRLKQLYADLLEIIKEISCTNDISVISATIRFDLNKFDLNADFVAGNFTFEI